MGDIKVLMDKIQNMVKQQEMTQINMDGYIRCNAK